MGQEQSKHGYKIERETKNGVVATKDGDTFLIRQISLGKMPQVTKEELIKEIEILKATSHPHVLSLKNSFQDGDTYYIVMNHCQGGSLAEKIKEERESGQQFEEFEILDWIVQICMAMKHIHDKFLLHKDLMPEAVFLTEFGTVCLGGFGKVNENATSQSASNPLDNVTISYLAPETLTHGMYNTASDIWSVGCILHELGSLKAAFSAETTIKLIPKILGGSYPSLPDRYSPELRGLLSDIFSKDQHSRPTAGEILGRPFIISFLSKKSKETVKELQDNLDKLRAVADGLERVHQGATLGSLAGGVIGAAGGITSIVGLILAPFTLGASLVVTGVGVGVAVAGGATAGVSNITNMVNQSSDRKAIRSILKGFQEKIISVVQWVQEISEGLDNLRKILDSDKFKDRDHSVEDLARLGLRAGRGLSSVAELVRWVQVMNIGRVAAQTARAVRVVEVVGGVLAGLFVAVDIFFIAMDAKEIHHIRQAKAAEAADQACSDQASSEAVPEAHTTVPTSDQAALVSNTDESAREQEAQSSPGAAEAQSSPGADEVGSEIMRFVRSIRQTADTLQKVLDDIKFIVSGIPSLEG